MIPLFDLHADTLGEMYKKKELLSKNSLHISYESAKNFEPYIQVMAIWSDFRLNNSEAYSNFLKIYNYARAKKLAFATKANEIKSRALILSVEDARLLDGELSRLDLLHRLGVRTLTLNWKGESIVGGAWDTDLGLSRFGKAVVERAFSLGIIPDVSHSSQMGAYDAIELASLQNKPIIASHSNAFGVCDHKRNLTDELFCQIKSLGGAVGISLAPEHLGENASVASVIKHIYHYLSLGGENTVCLGCDFDGVASLPKGISGIGDLHLIYSKLEKVFGQEIANKIFFQNAYNFFINSL